MLDLVSQFLDSKQTKVDVGKLTRFRDAVCHSGDCTRPTAPTLEAPFRLPERSVPNPAVL